MLKVAAIWWKWWMKKFDFNLKLNHFVDIKPKIEFKLNKKNSIGAFAVKRIERVTEDWANFQRILFERCIFIQLFCVFFYCLFNVLSRIDTTAALSSYIIKLHIPEWAEYNKRESSHWRNVTHLVWFLLLLSQYISKVLSAIGTRAVRTCVWEKK